MIGLRGCFEGAKCKRELIEVTSEDEQGVYMGENARFYGSVMDVFCAFCNYNETFPVCCDFSLDRQTFCSKKV